MEIKRTDDKKGWLIPYLLGLDNMFYKRWEYWTRICLSDRLDPDPIPFVHFQPSHTYQQKQVYKNITKCLDYTRSVSNPLEAFIDWLLWGFNQGEKFPAISDKEDDFWYRTFNMGLFYLEPADHWGDLASEYIGRNNALGFFATPGSVVEMIVRMTFGGEPKHEHKTMSVCDSCCGTGNMLLYASNYSFNLYGVDISHLLTKIAKVNGFIYVPWLVYKPKNLTIFDEIKRSAIVEIELPTGIKIPHCNVCGNENNTFLMDVETKHQLTTNNGLITVDNPELSKDLITRKLKPENISCARCHKEFEKEGVK